VILPFRVLRVGADPQLVLGYTPVVAYAAGQPYTDSPFILGLEYAPVSLRIGHEAWRLARRGHEAREGQSPNC
jgi:hypothetical protein